MTERGGRQDQNQQQQKPAEHNHQEENRPLDDEGLRARLDRLSGALDAKRTANQAAEEAKRGQEELSGGNAAKAMTLAVRILSEFVAAVIVGGLLGWGIDYAAGTTPAFLIVFLLMGAAAGFWNVYQIAMKPPGSLS